MKKKKRMLRIMSGKRKTEKEINRRRGVVRERVIIKMERRMEGKIRGEKKRRGKKKTRR